MSFWSRLRAFYDVYVDSWAAPIFVVGMLVVLFLPAKSDLGRLVAIGTLAFTLGLVVERLPRLSADIEVDRWFQVIIGFYFALVFAYYQNGIGTRRGFSAAIIPAVIFSSIYTMWKADDDDLKH